MSRLAPKGEIEQHPAIRGNGGGGGVLVDELERKPGLIEELGKVNVPGHKPGRVVERDVDARGAVRVEQGVRAVCGSGRAEENGSRWDCPDDGARLLGIQEEALDDDVARRELEGRLNNQLCG